MKKKTWGVLLALLCISVSPSFALNQAPLSARIVYCEPTQGVYATNIRKCFGKDVALIGVLSSEVRDGQQVYVLERPQWNDRSRLSFPAKNGHFYNSPDDVGKDVPKIYVNFTEVLDARMYVGKQVRLAGKIGQETPIRFKCSGAPGERLVSSETKFSRDNDRESVDYCVKDNGDLDITLQAEGIQRYILPETWLWMDHELNMASKLRSKETIKAGVEKTAKFWLGLVSGPDCLFLDSSDQIEQFKKVVLAGTENGSWQEYVASNIKMAVRGDLERRVYDLGPCGHCPEGAMCDMGPCGEHTYECINPIEIQRGDQ